MKRTSLLALLFLFCLVTGNVHAQDAPVEMADLMRSNGKIYVVVGVLLLIFAGIVIYLIRLEKKLAEKKK